MMNVAVIQFPGTNCDLDTKYAFEKLGAKASLVWHKDTALPKDIDLVVIAGGFSYGDYLRSGAIARFSPIMRAVCEFANRGGFVLGICNGFQILLEVKLLDGAMKRNENLHFVSKYQYLKVINRENRFLSKTSKDILHIPIAHAEGNYFADEKTLKGLRDNNQILLKYCDETGESLNPNGSIEDIAGITNRGRNVFGLMPHPERAIEDILGSSDGVEMLNGFFN
jgi:phosphoribosylformylglycinamidine synthase